MGVRCAFMFVTYSFSFITLSISLISLPLPPTPPPPSSFPSCCVECFVLFFCLVYCCGVCCLFLVRACLLCCVLVCCNFVASLSFLVGLFLLLEEVHDDFRQSDLPAPPLRWVRGKFSPFIAHPLGRWLDESLIRVLLFPPCTKT